VPESGRSPVWKDCTPRGWGPCGSLSPFGRGMDAKIVERNVNSGSRARPSYIEETGPVGAGESHKKVLIY